MVLAAVYGPPLPLFCNRLRPRQRYRAGSGLPRKGLIDKPCSATRQPHAEKSVDRLKPGHPCNLKLQTPPLCCAEKYSQRIPGPAIKPACFQAGLLAVCHDRYLAGLLAIMRACFQSDTLSSQLSCSPARHHVSKLSGQMAFLLSCGPVIELACHRSGTTSGLRARQHTCHHARRLAYWPDGNLSGMKNGTMTCQRVRLSSRQHEILLA